MNDRPNPASFARPNHIALADDNIRVSAAALIRTCERILKMTAPGDFLASNDGIAFLNTVYSMTEIDAIYDKKLDVEHEFRTDLDRERGL